MEPLKNAEYHILVVEDDKEIRDGIEIFLKSQGYQVHKAADGLEGLEEMEKNEIHLAIVDIMMPRMDGVTMTMRLREKYDFPVIMLSAKSEETDKVIGLNIGADDYVTKPFTPLELMARVNSQLRRYIRFVNKNGAGIKTERVYVIGGLEYARQMGCHTVGISCNPGSAVGKAAELAIEVVPGPECLTGSTRLKAGTAQKLILNMISTATMVRCGKAFQNLMVDVVPTNEKLRVRAENIVMEATGVTRERAKEALRESQDKVKTAILMILVGCGREEAEEKLEKTNGHIREAMK